ncbi:hypothetical protein C5B42_00745 [Candidatus Cerribacteria bacterium 'Amazon FNV 2010 28 9']|uniref:Uncharacterized protein n=1 Tax=Candidatus Cerribacteria bacterium 'Amazon FNV 2010 28 9' TaxID=2081795 RepID=A0A317JU31_9BACT|nr:MAG: hypothetical protein C5B42_00745 [Candidatus Cerribacteria bacterium 'Amazon FNV 2010 28 9']
MTEQNGAIRIEVGEGYTGGEALRALFAQGFRDLFPHREVPPAYWDALTTGCITVTFRFDVRAQVTEEQRTIVEQRTREAIGADMVTKVHV